MTANGSLAVSAVLYSVARLVNNKVTPSELFSDDSEHWVALLEAGLCEADHLAIVDGVRCIITLSSTDESDALKIARLVRNSFQLSVVPNCTATLSIAVVLYARGNAEPSKFVQVAQELAENNDIQDGNNILLRNIAA